MYLLYSHCIPVKGAVRSVICDLQQGIYYFIPNDLYEILIENRVLDRDLLIQQFGDDNAAAINDYLLLLNKNEGIFEIDDHEDAKLFPKLSLDFDEPSIVDNAIIDVENDFDNLINVLPELEKLGCMGILIRVLKPVSEDKLTELINLFELSSIQHVEILISQKSSFDVDFIKKIFRSHLRLNLITVFNAPTSGQTEIYMNEDQKMKPIGVYNELTESFNIQGHCPAISPETFVLNLKFFSESQSFNNCLNKKVSISANGDIKNCPSITRVFGNIKNTSIMDAISDESFQELWMVKKDSIEICKDCEFRYICSDCRASTEKYKKPSGCSYDPYTARWLEGSLNSTFKKNS